jgi:hypothetical protein
MSINNKLKNLISLKPRNNAYYNQNVKFFTALSAEPDCKGNVTEHRNIKHPKNKQ